MHTLVVSTTVRDREKLGTFLRDEIIPRFRQAPGFVAGQWVRFEAGRGIGMVTFDSEEAARAAAEPLTANAPPVEALTIDSLEIGEVVARIEA